MFFNLFQKATFVPRSYIVILIPTLNKFHKQTNKKEKKNLESSKLKAQLKLDIAKFPSHRVMVTEKVML